MFNYLAFLDGGGNVNAEVAEALGRNWNKWIRNEIQAFRTRLPDFLRAMYQNGKKCT
jgi:hypothetical protein